MARARGMLWLGSGIFYGQGKGYSMARVRGILWVFYGQG